MERSYGMDSWGWFLEVYDEEGDRVGRWYGTRAACLACPSELVELHLGCSGNAPDPFDLMCERRYD